MNVRIFSSGQWDDADIEALASDHLHIWFFSLRDRKHLEPYFHSLSAGERLRAEQLLHPLDQDCYILAHTALRKLLGAYLGCPPQDLRFSIGEHGKPSLSLSSPCSTRIHFNLSHSGEQIVLAFSLLSEVGIDIQKVDMAADTDKIRKRFFHSAEESFFSGLKKQEKQLLFYRFWTIREAFLKALGCGLTLSPGSFCVEPLEKEDEKKDTSKEMSLPQLQYFKISKSRTDYSAWEIQSITAPSGYLCSVAYNSILISR